MFNNNILSKYKNYYNNVRLALCLTKCQSSRKYNKKFFENVFIKT